MKWLYAITLLLAGALTIGLTGCFGSTDSLAPDISFTLPDNLGTLPTVNPGENIGFKWEVKLPEKGDTLKSVTWSQTSDPAGHIGRLNIQNNTNNIWQAPPDWNGPGDLRVDVKLEAETVLGGKTTKTFSFWVRPLSEVQ